MLVDKRIGPTGTAGPILNAIVSAMLPSSRALPIQRLTQPREVRIKGDKPGRTLEERLASSFIRQPVQPLTQPREVRIKGDKPGRTLEERLASSFIRQPVQRLTQPREVRFKGDKPG